MKGIVFVEFSRFIEEQFGDAFWDEVIDEANLPSEGAYTTVATYDDAELNTLIALVCEKKGLSSKQAQQAFGKWLFSKLYNAAPPEAHNFTDVFEFLRAVENVIHVEVKKLNPDAILPEFEFLTETDSVLTMQYKSPRGLCYFCEGLIQGLSEHTKQKTQVRQTECLHAAGERCVIEVKKI